MPGVTRYIWQLLASDLLIICTSHVVQATDAPEAPKESEAKKAKQSTLILFDWLISVRGAIWACVYIFEAQIGSRSRFGLMRRQV